MEILRVSLFAWGAFVRPLVVSAQPLAVFGLLIGYFRATSGCFRAVLWSFPPGSATEK